MCAGWSEPLLVAHTTLLEISCRSSFVHFRRLLKRPNVSEGSEQYGEYMFILGPVMQIFVRKIVIIFLSINLNICFGCSKESSH